jgi:hypothetical protein
MRPSLLPIALLLASPLLSAPTPVEGPPTVPSFWRYVHPKAKMLVGIDFGRIWRSQAGQRIRRGLEEAGMRKISAESGFGFMPDIDRVLLSTTGETPKKGQQPPVVLAIQGKYESAAVRRDLAKKGAVRYSYKGAEIYRRPATKGGSSNNMVLALVNPQTMLMGDGPSIKAAIDLHGAADPSAHDNTLMRRATELDGLYDIWLASEVSPEAVAEGAVGSGKLQGPAAIFAATEAFEGGLSFAKGLAIDFAFRNSSDADAEKMAAAMSLLLQMAASGSNHPEAAEFLKKVEIKAAGERVHLALAWDEQQVAAGLNLLESRIAGNRKPVATPTTAHSRPVAELAKPAPATIRIFNLDGGTREVPLR